MKYRWSLQLMHHFEIFSTKKLSCLLLRTFVLQVISKSYRHRNQQLYVSICNLYRTATKCTSVYDCVKCDAQRRNNIDQWKRATALVVVVVAKFAPTHFYLFFRWRRCKKRTLWTSARLLLSNGIYRFGTNAISKLVTFQNICLFWIKILSNYLF